MVLSLPLIINYCYIVIKINYELLRVIVINLLLLILFIIIMTQKIKLKPRSYQ